MRVSLNETSQAEWQANNLEHLRYEYDLAQDDLVIDVGAYRGDWGSQIFCRYGCKLVSIDPGPWLAGFPIGKVINKAAASYDGLKNFGGAYYYSSSFEDANTQYSCFDINRLLTEYADIALLKINIEGAEYELLEHIIGAGLQQRIKNFQVQFHSIEDQPYQDWYQAIFEKLSKSHVLTWHYPFCWENWERL